MIKTFAHRIISVFKVRSILALSAVGLAILPALHEHGARAELAERKLAGESPDAIPQASPQPLEGAKYGLSPDPELLDTVAVRIQGRPSFDHKAGSFDEIIQEAAMENSVSPVLVKAVIQAESRFNAQAVSPQGAVGLMQILPSTARSMGFSSPQLPRENVRAGARYLRVLLSEFGNEESLAIAAYNCGPDKVRRYGNHVPPINETRVFVARVLEYYNSYIES
jgi:soluble lytic murein transglycosylase-like protein